jgi:ZIP family zinc transporter
MPAWEQGLLSRGDVDGNLVWRVFWVAVLTDLATGVGALPLAFVRRVSEVWQGRMTAAAGGMMLSAAMFTLTGEAMNSGAAWQVLAGLLAGSAFFAWTAVLVRKRRWRIGSLNADDSRHGVLVIAAMFIHSIPEGIAIGVGYATGEMRFGLVMAIAIAVHNIPEGLAVSIPLRARGVPVLKCVAYAILTSVPQPLAAVPSFQLASVVHVLVPVGLGFAGGAMMFLVAYELLPESTERCGRMTSAWALMLGLVAMLGFTVWLGAAPATNRQ